MVNNGKQTCMVMNENSFISVSELNHVLHFCTNYGVNKEVEIKFQNNIEKIDIYFIAGLILFNQEYGTKFKITNFIPAKRIFEIRQYLKQYENIYDADWKNVFPEIWGIRELNPEDFVASESFAPIIFIDKQNIDVFFTQKPMEGSNKNLYELCLKYIEKERNSNKNENDYFNSDKSIKKELYTYPPIYIFVFSILYSKINPFEKSKEKNVDPVQRTLEIWEFTKKYVTGVHELAKNIVEHSNTKRGIITIRTYDSIENMQDGNMGKVLETHVTDFGTQGIIPHLLKNTLIKSEGNDPHTSTIYKKDLIILQKDFKLKDFVEPKVNKYLQHQLYRDIAHYGLMKFYQLIINNEGVVVSSSIGKDGKRDIYSSKESDKVISLDFGTSYFFQLPFRNELSNNQKQINAGVQTMQGTSDTVSGLSEMMDMILIRRIEDIPEGHPYKKTILCVDWEGEIKERDDEAIKCMDLDKLNPHGKTGYIAINMVNLSLSPSSLLRIMAHLSHWYNEPIIIYNVDFEVYWQMVKDNELYYKTFKVFDEELPYWYRDKSILIYSKTNSNSYSFADILFGRNEKEFQAANYIINHTFINALTVLNNFVNPDPKYNLQDCMHHFFYQSSLLPFDIFLKNNGDKTMLQTNLEVLLQQELKVQSGEKTRAKVDISQLDNKGVIEKLDKYVHLMEGYKMSNTHFKIGSKFHSEDFFYAKRLFQNSYYTARIAMLLAMKIKQEMPEKNREVTIVGYEMYSELLLGLISKFLTEYGYKYVNRFITLDVDESMICIPKNSTATGSIIIVVPISSTGSTSLKIKEYLVDKLKCNFEPEPPKIFNVITVFDPEYGNNDQGSLVNLFTKWHLPIDCKWCFDNERSQPLFETDKTSITPALIFNYPESKRSDEQDGSIDFSKVNFEEALLYKKVKRNNEYLLYATDTNVLIDKNKKKIINWLGIVKKELSIQRSEKVVILSPCHYSNTQFINLINEYVFNSSATIIHYQSDADYVSNFRFIYENFLTQEDRKIVYVDDTLTSGKTFFKIYDLFRNIAKYKKELSAAIILNDNSSPNVRKRVSRAMGERDNRIEEETKQRKKESVRIRKNNLFSFVNINLPSSPRIFKKNPLEHEVKRYKYLAENVLHDRLKKEFFDKTYELSKFDTNIKDKGGIEKRSGQHYKMFKANHYCYDFFDNTLIKEQIDFDSMKFEEFLKKCNFNEADPEDKISVMKVLSQYPFLLYMPVRKKVFQWHKEWLQETINRLSRKLERINSNVKASIIVKSEYDVSDLDEIVTTDDFQELKFLIRRSVFLGNYRILSQDFFQLLSKMMNHIGDIDIEKGEKTPMTIRHFTPKDLYCNTYLEKPLSKIEKNNLKNFYIFILRQYIELIQKNPWCAYHINESLVNEATSFKTYHGLKFSRMLSIEIAMVMGDFYEMLLNKRTPRKEWINLYKEKARLGGDTNTKIVIDPNNIEIRNFLEKNEINFTDKNKFLLVNKVLKLTNDDGTFKEAFLNYLWIKQFLYTDKQRKAAQIPLTEKTEKIFTKIRGFFKNEKNIGVFFIVTDGKKQPHLVYDWTPDGESLLKELDENNHELLYSFLKGKSNDIDAEKKVIIEYLRTDGIIWTDQYNKIKPKTKKFIGEYKWLLLIRLNDKESQTIGLIGFYCDNKEQGNDILAKQLLMLLCKDFTAFIMQHHKNDEFADLREAEATRRFAYLAGHGRQMMQKLAQSNAKEFGTIVGTMEKLQYLFATKYISSSGNSSEQKKKLCDELLKTFYTENISVNDLSNIQKMAELIYESTNIENSIKKNNYKITYIATENLSFRFNKEILHFICFELIVNAKKNRFHFTNAYNECFPDCCVNRNKLSIEVSMENDQLKIIVSGTGAMIPQTIRDRINSGHDPKPNNEISGLALIRKIIKTLNNDNNLTIECIAMKETPEGEVKCKCELQSCIIHENKVVIHLNPLI